MAWTEQIAWFGRGSLGWLEHVSWICPLLLALLLALWARLRRNKGRGIAPLWVLVCSIITATAVFLWVTVRQFGGGQGTQASRGVLEVPALTMARRAILIGAVVFTVLSMGGWLLLVVRALRAPREDGSPPKT